ncbi:hypothetical protein [Vibrio sp. Vb2201]|uniref:hypothetical protein n=1 Tax=Vibrio sp. Vb2201 TaxID=3074655 RepID=UPI001DAB25D1|nr:hypothetical protein [Vibrio sp. Vb2201]EGR1219803.1 hypothetical protein [Vibrio parahaemolyticus]MDW1798941.1 hypothetical protein [Vibrio sp. Vb2201]
MYKLILLVFPIAVLLGCQGGGTSSEPDKNPETEVTPPNLSEDDVVLKLDANRASIYIKGADPLSNKWLEYEIVRFQSEKHNADIWRINNLYQASASELNYPFHFIRDYQGRSLTTNGEWDKAILEKGAGDFIGGAHGDEKLSTFYIKVDGKEVDGQDKKTYISDTVELHQTTDLFSWYDKSTLAKTSRTYKFHRDGVNVHQKMEWKDAASLKTSYLAMFPVLRTMNEGEFQVTDTAWYWPDGHVQDISIPGFKIQQYKQDEIWVEGAESGLRAEIKIERTPRLEGFSSFVTNSPAYNKVYFDITGAHDTKAGEVWETNTQYKITTYK